MPFPLEGHPTFDLNVYTPNPHLAEAARLAAGRQVAAIESAQAQPDIRQELLQSIVGRRAGDPDLKPARVHHEQDDEFLVSPVHLLVRRSDLTRRTKRRQRRLGFSAEPVPELDGDVVRLVNPNASKDEANQLRVALGKRAAFSYRVLDGMNTKRTGTPEPDPGPPRPPRPANGRPASRVQVAVLDTGVARDVRADGWLAGLTTEGNIDELNVLPKGNPDDYLDYGAGHGTFVAGIVQQLAPDCDLVVRRVMDTDGVASEVDVAAAIIATVSELLQPRGRLILNLSFGTETDDDRPPRALEHAITKVRRIQKERRADLMIVAAAGNEGRRRPVWPAAFPGVVAVAGCERPPGPDRQPATGSPWSSRGPWVTCSAVAAGVLSTFVKGTEPGRVGFREQQFEDNAWALWTGTSFAAPQISGAVAYVAGRDSHVTLDAALAEVLRPVSKRSNTVPDYGALVQVLP